MRIWPKSSDVSLKISSGLYQGARDYQQDYVENLVITPEKVVCAVLSDGMGGHKYGNIASRSIATSCIKSLQTARADIVDDEANIPKVLKTAMYVANRKLSTIANEKADNEMMGGTLVIAAVHGNHLYWCSVGDSPLYLLRKNQLSQLNEVHSLGQGLSDLASMGKIKAKTLAKFQSNSTLTSVLNGRKLNQIDCPEKPFVLKRGDILLLASDGIETLSMDEIAEKITTRKPKSPAEICSVLLAEVEERQAEKQDNVSVTAISFG